MPASKELGSLGPNPSHPSLPPSVEEAYKRKCIDLKRRMNEVEESNDDYRRRKVRLLRGIRKMRLERAFLLETLAKRMKKSGSAHGGLNFVYDEDSDTTDGPPTPQEKPLRSKRGHRRPIQIPPSPPGLQSQMSAGGQSSFYQTPSSRRTTTHANGPTPILPHPSPSSQRLGAPGSSRQPAHASLLTTTSSSSAHNATLNNGPPEQPYTAYEDFSQQHREDILQNRSSDPALSSEEQVRDYIERKWAELPGEKRQLWENTAKGRMEGWRAAVVEWEREKTIAAGEDRMEGVEGEGTGGSGSGSGFTAVNG
ncbi:MAG: hypothetical protein MMC33_002002 [Icmadophila ericetorum]|nr:hypothetical protein [Icmadophila ericetorum]